MVDTDRVGAKLLHEGSIALALLGVDQGVCRGKLVGNSWVIVSQVLRVVGGASTGKEKKFTLEEELVAFAGEELISHSFDGGERMRKAGADHGG